MPRHTHPHRDQDNSGCFGAGREDGNEAQGLRPDDFRVRSFGVTAKSEIVPAEQSFVDGHISEISEMILEDYQSVIFGVRQPGL